MICRSHGGRPARAVDPFRPSAGMARIIAWGWLPAVEQVHLYTVRGAWRRGRVHRAELPIRVGEDASMASATQQTLQAFTDWLDEIVAAAIGGPSGTSLPT